MTLFGEQKQRRLRDPLLSLGEISQGKSRAEIRANHASLPGDVARPGRLQRGIQNQATFHPRRPGGWPIAGFVPEPRRLDSHRASHKGAGYAHIRLMALAGAE